jgi:hypothetical protein
MVLSRLISREAFRYLVGLVVVRPAMLVLCTPYPSIHRCIDVPRAVVAVVAQQRLAAVDGATTLC